MAKNIILVIDLGAYMLLEKDVDSIYLTWKRYQLSIIWTYRTTFASKQSAMNLFWDS